MDSNWQSWALGIAGSVILILGTAVYNLVLRWARSKDERDEIQQQKEELQTARLANLEERDRVKGEQLTSGTNRFTTHEVRLCSVEQNKVDRDGCLRHQKQNEMDHVELRASATRTEDSVETLKKGFREVVEKLDTTTQTITRIVARVVDDRGGVGK